MSSEQSVLLVAAASIGFFHTLFGPDHYLPFIAMAAARSWSIGKTAVITFVCGLGHIFGSVVLGFVGIGMGIAVGELEALESVRGNLAAWALIAFGLVYTAWGIRRAWRNIPHQHRHTHPDGVAHEHEHTHHGGHLHVHEAETGRSITPWVLFVVFVLGPCEPLIPLLMYPAAKGDLWDLISVTGAFGLVTVATMVTIVVASIAGVRRLPMMHLERYAHALAGATILLCGLSIQFLGL
jgi:sulfite exporter TauE/SafE